MDTQVVSIVQYVATYLCSYVAMALVFLLRCLLIAIWLPKATQLPKVAHIRGCEYVLQENLKFNWSEIAS